MSPQPITTVEAPQVRSFLRKDAFFKPSNDPWSRVPYLWLGTKSGKASVSIRTLYLL